MKLRSLSWVPLSFFYPRLPTPCWDNCRSNVVLPHNQWTWQSLCAKGCFFLVDMNLHIFILGSLAQYLPVGQMGSSGTFLPNFLASKIILSCSSPRPACDLVGDAVPASAALPAGQQEGGHKFTPPPKNSIANTSEWLECSEGSFWRKGSLLCTFRHFNAVSAVCGGREHHSGRTKQRRTRPQPNICPHHPNKGWSHSSTSHSGSHTEARWSRSLRKVAPAEVYQSLEGVFFFYQTAALMWRRSRLSRGKLISAELRLFCFMRQLFCRSPNLFSCLLSRQR